MAPSVGKLKFDRAAPRRREWVIGAAPRLPDHWMLSHAGHDAARLVLLFNSDDHARSEISDWLQSTSRAPGDEDSLITDYMERRLRDLHVDAGLSVAEARGEPALYVWLHAVFEERTLELPDEFVHIAYDVVLLPRREYHPGRLALLRESRIDSGITIANPRALIF